MFSRGPSADRRFSVKRLSISGYNGDLLMQPKLVLLREVSWLHTDFWHFSNAEAKQVIPLSITSSACLASVLRITASSTAQRPSDHTIKASVWIAHQRDGNYPHKQICWDIKHQLNDQNGLTTYDVWTRCTESLLRNFSILLEQGKKNYCADPERIRTLFLFCRELHCLIKR